VTFCRPHPSLARSPTLVEIIEAATLDPQRSLTEVVPNVAGLAALQGDRPLKSHGSPIASSAVAELIERVRSQGQRHWVQPPSDAFPFLRLWMGITADDLAGYRPSADGGLMIEVVDTATLMLPPEVFTPTGDTVDTVDLQPGDMARTAARCFLVHDLNRVLEPLADTFTWEPELGPEAGDDGSRRAQLGFELAPSAHIELLEPPAESAEGRFLDAWGPGVWSIRIAVRDLGAKGDDLRARGTPFTAVRTGYEQPDTVLRVDMAATPGCLFEFVEAAAP
jgi:hypothetical protein